MKTSFDNQAKENSLLKAKVQELEKPKGYPPGFIAGLGKKLDRLRQQLADKNDQLRALKAETLELKRKALSTVERACP